MLITKGSTPTIVFLMVDATDDETAETGLSPTVQFSKNGGSFSTASNSPSEIGNGWYKVVPTTTETNTEGPFIVRATGSGANEWRDYHQVVETIPVDIEKVDGTAVSGIADFKATGFSTHNAADAADSVWDEQKSAHTSEGTFGNEVQQHVWSSEIGTFPTAAVIADTVLDEMLAGHLLAGSLGEAISSLSTIVDPDELAQAVWEYTRRVLTVAVTAALSTPSSTVINLHRGDSIEFDITGLGDISSRTKLWVTIKTAITDDDNAAILQWEEGTGLVRLNGAAGTPANGAIVVNDAVAGDITVTLQESDSKDLVPATGLVYDVQMFDGTDITTLTPYGAVVNIYGDVTRAVS